MTGNMKANLHISNTAYNALIQTAYDLGYVRGGGTYDRPRGLSVFVSILPDYVWRDTRPSHLSGTGQWHQGTEPLRERCLHLSPHTIASLGEMALTHGIYPYKSQAPVVNGFRREAVLPRLHPVGATPPGATSVKALAAPVLEAIGLGYLTPTSPLARAPLDLYQGPSRRAYRQQHKRMVAVSNAM